MFFCAFRVRPCSDDTLGYLDYLPCQWCISPAEDIVLTREDYMRYGDRRNALAGFVQALLITHHMLFVGFGLADDNFHRILDDVRKVLGSPGDDSGAEAVGTVLSLVPEPLRQTLWDDELDIVPMSDDPRGNLSDAARRLEILLDFVVHLTGQRPSYLMNESYESLLTPDEMAVQLATRRTRSFFEDTKRREIGRALFGR